MCKHKYSCLCCINCSYKCKKELELKNFGFEHDRPELFATSQFGPRAFYPIWTTLFAVYHLVWLLLDLLYFKQASIPMYLIFLTNWGYIMITCLSVFNCATVLYVNFKRKDILKGEVKQMTWYLRLTWILSNIANSTALGITISFYVFLTPELTAPSIEKHVLNTVYVIINIFVTAMPVRVYHFYQPMLFGTIYVLFSLFYQLVGNYEPIYPVLNWTNYITTLLLSFGLTFIGLPLFHLFLFGLYKLRTTISDKYVFQRKKSIIDETIEL